MRLPRNLRCRLTEPGFETCLPEPCVIARKQCSFTDFRSRVTSIWVSNNFTWIFERGQAPPDQFIQAKLFRSRDFDGAICRRADRDPSHIPRYIVGGHRLDKTRSQPPTFATESTS